MDRDDSINCASCPFARPRALPWVIAVASAALALATVGSLPDKRAPTLKCPASHTHLPVTGVEVDHA